MAYQGVINKSRTLDKEFLAGAVGLIGVFQDKLPMVQDSLGNYYGWIMLGLAAVGYWLRYKTTGKVGDK